ncbi:hypothetical protein B4U80_03109 [Leptotrombidium deliense]|uniref:Uncharacterized protein n=1 Tax=Leptotrombidium deliense TaxID=299467 RepID=A0A443SSM9_9ACAR|nr:hypothetical protein B4U80_03109 [Leptotrombidium deliense]
MNHRLKSLIQSRQNNKGLGNSNGQSSAGYSTPSASQLPASNFTGANFPMSQQSTNNSSLSPHYMNASGLGTHSETYGQLSWGSPDSESTQNNGEGPVSNENKSERRTPFSSIDGHNGLNYNSYTHYERNTPSEPSYSVSEGGQQTPNTNGNAAQYLTSYSTSNTTTNQSQQQYSPLAQSPSLPQTPQSHTSAQEVPSFQTQSQSSATSPARSKSVESNAGGPEALSNGLNTSTNSSMNEESPDQQSQPFLSNTTTSMNTYTNIINTFNPGSSAYSSAMPSSPTYLLPAPTTHFGFYASGNQTVIMTSVPGNASESSKSFLPATTGVGHYMGIDCGRSINQADSSPTNSTFGLLDLNSYVNSKSDPPSSSSAPPFLTNESQVSVPANNVLPPVSLLLPSFREHGWWERMKGCSYGSIGKVELTDVNCENMDCTSEERTEREYNSRSPSLTTLPASISN